MTKPIESRSPSTSSEILDVSPTATRQQVEEAFLSRLCRLRSAFLELGGFDALPRSAQQTFDTYVVGRANRLALSACRSVCETPGSSFNPLYIYGRPGVGKSHLLSALCARIGELHPQLLVVSTTAERFTEELLTAMGNHSVAHFQNKYRHVDVLIIDGFQALGNRPRTQEELCAVLDPLVAGARQVVIASQTSPRDCTGLCDSLRSRLSSGLVVEIGYPDLETRTTIVRRHAEQSGLGLSREAAFTLARRIQHDIRELKGAVNRLLAHRQSEAPESDGRVQLDNLLYDLAPETRDAAYSLESVVACVCLWYDLDCADLGKRSATKKIRRARQVAMYLARLVTDASLQEVADAIGATPSQVLYAVRTVEKNLSDPLISADLDALRGSLAARSREPRSRTRRARTSRPR